MLFISKPPKTCISFTIVIIILILWYLELPILTDLEDKIKHPKYTIINYFIGQALKGKTIPVFGDGYQLRDYIFVEDLANAFIAASITAKSKGQVFNIGSGKGTSFLRHGEKIIEVVGNGFYKNIPWPKDYINVETGDYITNIDKAKEDTKLDTKYGL